MYLVSTLYKRQMGLFQHHASHLYQETALSSGNDQTEHLKMWSSALNMTGGGENEKFKQHRTILISDTWFPSPLKEFQRRPKSSKNSLYHSRSLCKYTPTSLKSMQKKKLGRIYNLPHPKKIKFMFSFTWMDVPTCSSFKTGIGILKNDQIVQKPTLKTLRLQKHKT